MDECDLEIAGRTVHHAIKFKSHRHTDLHTESDPPEQVKTKRRVAFKLLGCNSMSVATAGRFNVIDHH